MSKSLLPVVTTRRPPWNKGRLVGQKRPLQPKQVWAIRARLELANKLRDLALFNLAIDSKLRGCDLVRLRVNDLAVGNSVRDRVSVVQSKTAKPVQFEVTENTREVVSQWVSSAAMRGQHYLFPSRLRVLPHLSTRQYARLVRDWVLSIGLDPSSYGTHSLRRTKAALIYRKTGNLRAVQLLLGHSKVDSTVRYLGVELEDALSIAERIDL
ncbi:tyrosine-type recombinase/integrase [Ruegeria atlantica]|uniref:tyrosine-type recombinase/integrase n=1 Tax=Ruegeria atlantica TaxID=81569 RepID=UPI00147D1884|nr:tyrosine-type recombinase/integrase [Ruegeria atlantica]